MRSCSGACLKLTVFVFNGLFVLFGILLMVFGGLALREALKLKDVSGMSTGLFGCVIALGAAVCFITFLACCGALMENQCMLNSFATLVFLLIILETTAVIYAYSFRNKLEDAVVEGGQKLVAEYANNTDVQKIVDGIQWGGECCGFNSTHDWDDYKSPNASRHDFPLSCCDKSKSDSGFCFTPDYKTPCKESLVNGFHFGFKSTVVSLGLFIGIQFVSMLLACCLSQGIRREYFQFV